MYRESGGGADEELATESMVPAAHTPAYASIRQHASAHALDTESMVPAAHHNDRIIRAAAVLQQAIEQRERARGGGEQREREKERAPYSHSSYTHTHTNTHARAITVSTTKNRVATLQSEGAAASVSQRHEPHAPLRSEAQGAAILAPSYDGGGGGGGGQRGGCHASRQHGRTAP